jgi:hypothetical protein
MGIAEIITGLTVGIYQDGNIGKNTGRMDGCSAMGKIGAPNVGNDL